MGENQQERAHASEPARTSAHRFGDWLTVAEAVAYCADAGLSRTPKTIRKWAYRSHRDPESGELLVRREDVDNGFRWSVERASLDRKIQQELEFEARRGRTPVETGSNPSEPVPTGLQENDLANANENHSEPVRTGADLSDLVHELRERIKEKDDIIGFLQDELIDRRKGYEALADVITAFRLNAESNAGRPRIEQGWQSHREGHSSATDDPGRGVPGNGSASDQNDHPDKVDEQEAYGI